jgi:hypothetical protein
MCRVSWRVRQLDQTDPQKIDAGEQAVGRHRRVSCHAPGPIRQDQVPRLPGQHYAYPLKQLHGFRAPTYADLNGSMTAAQAHSDRESRLWRTPSLGCDRPLYLYGERVRLGCGEPARCCLRSLAYRVKISGPVLLERQESTMIRGSAKQTEAYRGARVCYTEPRSRACYVGSDSSSVVTCLRSSRRACQARS